MNDTKKILKSKSPKMTLNHNSTTIETDEWDKLLATPESDLLLDLMILKVEEDIKNGDFEDGGFDCK